MTPSTLAKKRRVSLQSMRELVQTLATRGWITRMPDPHDRHRLLLQLTDYGQTHYERRPDRFSASCRCSRNYATMSRQLCA